MSRINIRYYRAHPPRKEKELSPAAYIIWTGMTPEQKERFEQWAKDMNTTVLDFAEHTRTAWMSLSKRIHSILQNSVESIR